MGGGLQPSGEGGQKEKVKPCAGRHDAATEARSRDPAQPRPADERKEVVEYVPHSQQAHEAGSGGAAHAPRDGHSLSTAPRRIARKAGHCPRTATTGNLCPRLLLAPSSRVP